MTTYRSPFFGEFAGRYVRNLGSTWKELYGDWIARSNLFFCKARDFLSERKGYRMAAFAIPAGAAMYFTSLGIGNETAAGMLENAGCGTLGMGAFSALDEYTNGRRRIEESRRSKRHQRELARTKKMLGEIMEENVRMTRELLKNERNQTKLLRKNMSAA